jgi:hypothetical protein
MINDSYFVFEAETRGLPIPKNAVERFIFAVNLTNEDENPELVRWDMLEDFDVARATVISYKKQEAKVLKFLKSRYYAYQQDLDFSYEFVDWTIENFKGPWKYSTCSVAINLIFKYKEDAVFFRLAWMDN